MYRLFPVLALASLMTLAPNLVASPEPNRLEKFYGLWFGQNRVANNGVEANSSDGRATDLALWESTTGFNITWNHLGIHTGYRVTIHFTPATEPGYYKAEWINRPGISLQGTRAQMDDDKLMINLVSETRNTTRNAGYEFSVRTGSMTVRYRLSQGNEILEEGTRLLRKVKVVM